MQTFLKILCPVLLLVASYELYQINKLNKQITILSAKPHDPVCPTLKYDYSNADFEGIINYETAQAMANNYKSDKAKSFISTDAQTGTNAFVAEEDARSVWFSLDRLKNFIWHIENQNCNKGCKDSLGLRIYYAKYPDFNDPSQPGLLGLDNVPKSYAKHHTLFMVPTYKSENGVNVDFYPAGVCRAPIASSPTHTVAPENISIVHDISPYIFLFDVSGGTGDPQNHGGLIPPGDAAGTAF